MQETPRTAISVNCPYQCHAATVHTVQSRSQHTPRFSGTLWKNTLFTFGSQDAEHHTVFFRRMSYCDDSTVHSNLHEVLKVAYRQPLQYHALSLPSHSRVHHVRAVTFQNILCQCHDIPEHTMSVSWHSRTHHVSAMTFLNTPCQGHDIPEHTMSVSWHSHYVNVMTFLNTLCQCHDIPEHTVSVMTSLNTLCQCHDIPEHTMSVSWHSWTHYVSVVTFLNTLCQCHGIPEHTPSYMLMYCF